MSNDGYVAHARSIEKATGVPGELTQTELVAGRLAALAEANLVGSNDAVASAGESADGTLPGGAAEVASVEEDGRFAIGFTFGVDIHESHLERLSLAGEGVHMDREGVGEVGAVEVLGEWAFGDCSGSLRDGQAGEEAKGEQGESHGDVWLSG